MFGEVKTGVDFKLEKEANALLRQSRQGVTALSEKQDFFTEEQMANRLQHEVYNINGFPDPHICSGIYRRAFNPACAPGARPVGRFNSEEW